MKIAFIPIDNRPVCYNLPRMIAETDKSIQFFIPPINLLGGLTQKADIPGLFDWLMKLTDPEAIILSLDTLTYGGLIPSRRSPDSFETVRARVGALKEILEEKKANIYAFSSIMRISNNNCNIEEKEYWGEWGKKIFEYSYNTHKSGIVPQNTDIPREILDDYINTRRRNFEINKLYPHWQKNGLLNTLIFSKDDCAPYGFNIQEAEILQKMGAYVKTGADEIPLSLLARALPGEVKICPIFLEPDEVNLVSHYEDISIKQSVESQIELAGCKTVDEKNADILLYVNNFKKHQGEIVMKIPTESFQGVFKTPDRPYMIADVRFANGADNAFVKALFENDIKDKYFYGYSAWNTSANSLGSLICAAKYKFLARKYDKNNFTKLQTIRFLDDWAYQANIRQTLSKPDVNELCTKMKNFENIISKKLKTNIDVSYSFPWNRLFEVCIEFN